MGKIDGWQAKQLRLFQRFWAQYLQIKTIYTTLSVVYIVKSGVNTTLSVAYSNVASHRVGTN